MSFNNSPLQFYQRLPTRYIVQSRDYIFSFLIARQKLILERDRLAATVVSQMAERERTKQREG